MPTTGNERMSVIRIFAANMVQPSSPNAPLTFEPDYSNPPRFADLGSEGRRFITHYLRRPIGRDAASLRAGLFERAETCQHEAAHLGALIVVGSGIWEAGIRGRTPSTVHGWTNLPDGVITASDVFVSLSGVAWQEYTGRPLERAGDDMRRAKSLFGPTLCNDDDVPAVLDLAREFVRAAHGPINFMARWLLICTAQSGKVGRPWLHAIKAAVHPHVIAIARQMRLREQLKAIQQVRDLTERQRSRELADSPPPPSIASLLDHLDSHLRPDPRRLHCQPRPTT